MSDLVKVSAAAGIKAAQIYSELLRYTRTRLDLIAVPQSIPTGKNLNRRGVTLSVDNDDVPKNVQGRVFLFLSEYDELLTDLNALFLWY